MKCNLLSTIELTAPSTKTRIHRFFLLNFRNMRNNCFLYDKVSACSREGTPLFLKVLWNRRFCSGSVEALRFLEHLGALRKTIKWLDDLLGSVEALRFLEEIATTQTLQRLDDLLGHTSKSHYSFGNEWWMSDELKWWMKLLKSFKGEIWYSSNSLNQIYELFLQKNAFSSIWCEIGK